MRQINQRHPYRKKDERLYPLTEDMIVCKGNHSESIKVSIKANKWVQQGFLIQDYYGKISYLCSYTLGVNNTKDKWRKQSQRQ